MITQNDLMVYFDKVILYLTDLVLTRSEKINFGAQIFLNVHLQRV